MLGLNKNDILETINMIRDEHLDIRTVTMGISLFDCVSDDPKRLCDNIYDKITKTAGNLIPVCQTIEKEYGIDVNVEALKIAKERLNFKSNNLHEPKLIRANSTNLKGIVPDNSVDFIFAHPPYANIIKYSKDIKEDLSRLELKEFLNQMNLFSKECFRILKEDKYCAVLIGDIRKDKNVIPLGFYIMNIFIQTGFTLKEIIIKEQHNCKMTDYWKNKNMDFYLLAHEYIFIFQKTKFDK